MIDVDYLKNLTEAEGEGLEGAELTVYEEWRASEEKLGALFNTETKLQNPKDAVAYKIELKEALASGKEATVEIEVYLGKAVEMFPKEISQREKQLVSANVEKKRKPCLMQFRFRLCSPATTMSPRPTR